MGRVRRGVSASDAFREERNIFVIRQEHDSLPIKCLEVRGRHSAGGYSEPTDGDIRDMPHAVDERCPGVFATVFLKAVSRCYCRQLVDVKMDAVFTPPRP